MHGTEWLRRPLTAIRNGGRGKYADPQHISNQDHLLRCIESPTSLAIWANHSVLKTTDHHTGDSRHSAELTNDPHHAPAETLPFAQVGAFRDDRVNEVGTEG